MDKVEIKKVHVNEHAQSGNILKLTIKTRYLYNTKQREFIQFCGLFFSHKYKTVQF